jgi:hypothetical protein
MQKRQINYLAGLHDPANDQIHWESTLVNYPDSQFVEDEENSQQKEQVLDNPTQDFTGIVDVEYEISGISQKNVSETQSSITNNNNNDNNDIDNDSSAISLCEYEHISDVVDEFQSIF